MLLSKSHFLFLTIPKIKRKKKYRLLKRYSLLALATTMIFSCSKDPFISGPDLTYYENLLEIDTDVTQDPSGIAPLTAKIDLSMEVEHKISITIRGKNNDNITHDFQNFGTHHQIPVLGLYANHQNEVLLSAFDRLGRKVGEKSLNITTDSIPQAQAFQLCRFAFLPRQSLGG